MDHFEYKIKIQWKKKTDKKSNMYDICAFYINEKFQHIQFMISINI